MKSTPRNLIAMIALDSVFFAATGADNREEETL
jgi:hypothetical protein